MSALGPLRVPLAAFVAACLAGLGLGLVLSGGDDEPSAPRAQGAPVRTTELARQQIPATPQLRVGASPAAAPVRVTPPSAGVRPQVQQTPQQSSNGSSGSSGNGGFQVTDEPVASP